MNLGVDYYDDDFGDSHFYLTFKPFHRLHPQKEELVLAFGVCFLEEAADLSP